MAGGWRGKGKKSRSQGSNSANDVKLVVQDNTIITASNSNSNGWGNSWTDDIGVVESGSMNSMGHTEEGASGDLDFLQNGLSLQLPTNLPPLPELKRTADGSLVIVHNKQHTYRYDREIKRGRTSKKIGSHDDNGTTGEDLQGYKSVNGQLLSNNDVGVLLREASNRVESRKPSTRIVKGKRASLPKKKLAFLRTADSTGATTVASTFGKSFRKKSINRKRIREPTIAVSTRINRKNPLIINTHSKCYDKLLVIYNLSIGTNEANLRNIIERLGKTELSSMKVKDLSTGSAVAYLSLADATLNDLEKVKDVFDGASVDGRTIKVEIVPKASVPY